MNSLDSLSSTSDQIYTYQHRQDIKDTRNFILARIKYIRGLDYYDILNKKDFSILMDQLSINARNKPCEDQIKTLIFIQCPKQLKNGVKLGNIVQIITQNIFDNTIQETKRQILKNIFLRSDDKNATKKRPSPYKIVLLTIGGLTGISILLNKISSAFPKLTQTGIQCNITQQHSHQLFVQRNIPFFDRNLYHSPNIYLSYSIQNRLLGYWMYFKNTSATTNNNLVLQNSFDKVVQFSKINNDESIRQAKTNWREIFQFIEQLSLIVKNGANRIFGYFSKGLICLREFVLGMFCEKQLMRNGSYKLSYESTIVSLINILPIICLIWFLYKGHRDDSHKQNKSLRDRFYQ